MRTMIKLDWLSMKCYWIRSWVVVAGVIIIGMTSEMMILPITSFYMLSYSVNPFAVEEKGKLDHLYLTLPISRQDVVNARFALSAVMQMIGLAGGIFLTVLMSGLFSGKTFIYPRSFHADFESMLTLVSVSILIYAIMNLFTFPMLFKLGYIKGKVWGFYIPVAVFSLTMYPAFLITSVSSSVAGAKIFSIAKWSMEHTVWMSFLLLTAALFILFISYTLSSKIYERREF